MPSQAVAPAAGGGQSVTFHIHHEIMIAILQMFVLDPANAQQKRGLVIHNKRNAVRSLWVKRPGANSGRGSRSHDIRDYSRRQGRSMKDCLGFESRVTRLAPYLFQRPNAS